MILLQINEHGIAIIESERDAVAKALLSPLASRSTPPQVNIGFFCQRDRISMCLIDGPRGAAH
jgi:hypothetical protein